MERDTPDGSTEAEALLEPRELIPSDPPITMNLPKLFIQGRLDLSLVRGDQVRISGQEDGNSGQAEPPPAP